MEKYPQARSSLVGLASDLSQFQNELEIRNRDKDELVRILSELKKEIAVIKSRSLKLKLKNDKKANQMLEYNAKVNNLKPEETILTNEIRQARKELSEIIRENEQYKNETQILKQEIIEQRANVTNLIGIVSRAQKELQLQLRERDRYKAEAQASSRHVASLEGRVKEWMIANETFVGHIQSKKLESQSLSSSFVFR